MNIRKKLSVVMAAVMCFTTMALAAPAASAASTANDAVYKEVKDMVGVSYNSALAKTMKTYNSKKASSTVKFSKSRTKKIYTKINDAIKNGKGYSLGYRNASTIIEVAVKGKKTRITGYSDGEGIIMYMDKKDLTICSLNPDMKFKLVIPASEMGSDLDSAYGSLDDYLDGLGDASSVLNSGLADNAKMSVFKFKYKEKTYVYERLDEGGKVVTGYLFNEEGTPVMAYDGSTDMYLGLKIKYSVPNSTFTVPDGFIDLSAMLG